jgi:hypothetical protein
MAANAAGVLRSSLETVAPMSTGLCPGAPGIAACTAARVASANTASSMPAASATSQASAVCPPEIPPMAMRPLPGLRRATTAHSSDATSSS